MDAATGRWSPDWAVSKIGRPTLIGNPWCFPIVEPYGQLVVHRNKSLIDIGIWRFGNIYLRHIMCMCWCIQFFITAHSWFAAMLINLLEWFRWESVRVVFVLADRFVWCYLAAEWSLDESRSDWFWLFVEYIIVDHFLFSVVFCAIVVTRDSFRNSSSTKNDFWWIILSKNHVNMLFVKKNVFK